MCESNNNKILCLFCCIKRVTKGDYCDECVKPFPSNVNECVIKQKYIDKQGTIKYVEENSKKLRRYNMNFINSVKEFIQNDLSKNYIDIIAFHNDDNIAGVWKINKEGGVFNTTSKKHLKINKMSHNKQRSEYYRFSRKMTDITEIRISKLLQTYFPEDVYRKSIIFDTYKGKKLASKYKLYENNKLYTLIPQRKHEKNISNNLRIHMNEERCEDLIKGYIDQQGYHTYNLRYYENQDRHEKQFGTRAHRLLKQLFDPREDEENLVVDHIDNNPLNNKLSNLRWISQAGNCQNKKVHNDPDVCISTKNDNYIVTVTTNKTTINKSFENKQQCIDFRNKIFSIRRENPDIDKYTLYSKLNMNDNKKSIRRKTLSQPPTEDNNILKVKLDVYFVYIDGRIWSCHNGGFMKPYKNKNGYYAQHFCSKTWVFRKTSWYVHRLIAKLFFPNNDYTSDTNEFHVDHIDRDRTNNHASNLRYVTPKDNSKNRKPRKI